MVRWRRVDLRRRAGPAIVALAAAWTLGCGVRGMIYPAPGLAVGPPPVGMEELEVELDGGASVHGWFHREPRAGRPAVVFFHGNGENLETMRLGGLIEDLQSLGVSFVVVDYPGYGRSRGRPSEEANRRAARAALEWLDERTGEAPLVAAGWSLGAAVAADLAAGSESDVRAAVLLSPWTRLEDVASAHFPRFLVRLLLSERYDSLAAAGRILGPTLVIHGLDDRIIPADQGRQVAESLAGGTRWVPIPGAGHNDLLGRPEVWQELRAFLASL